MGRLCPRNKRCKVCNGALVPKKLKDAKYANGALVPKKQRWRNHAKSGPNGEAVATHVVRGNHHVEVELQGKTTREKSR